MAIEQGLYAQVIMVCPKDLKKIATDKKTNEAKFKFQGQSERSQRWFDLDLDWIEVNFSTREPDLYKKLFQIYDYTQDINTFKCFQVPIGKENVWNHFSFEMMPQFSSIVINN